MITKFNTGLAVYIRTLMLSPGRHVNNVGVVLHPRLGSMNASVLMSLWSRYRYMSCDYSRSSLSRTLPRHRPKIQKLAMRIVCFQKASILLRTSFMLSLWNLVCCCITGLKFNSRKMFSSGFETRLFNSLCPSIYVVVCLT